MRLILQPPKKTLKAFLKQKPLRSEINLFKENLIKLLSKVDEIEPFIEKKINDFPSLIDFSKWGSHLPMKYQVKLIKDKFFDFKGAELFIKSIVPVVC